MNTYTILQEPRLLDSLTTFKGECLTLDQKIERLAALSAGKKLPRPIKLKEIPF